MNKLALTSTALLLLAAGCVTGNTRVAGTGPVETREVPVTTVERVHVSGSADVRITASTGQTRATLTAPADVLDALDVRTDGGKLVVGTKPGLWIDHRVIVDVQTPKIVGVGVSGSAKVNVTGVSADLFEVDVSGSAVVTAAGIANEARVRVSGSAAVNFLDLTADAANVGVSGSADVKLTVVKSLTSSVSGSAKIEYRGEPTQVQSSSSGSARIVQIK
jgi:hypothetical protein